MMYLLPDSLCLRSCSRKTFKDSKILPGAFSAEDSDHPYFLVKSLCPKSKRLHQTMPASASNSFMRPHMSTRSLGSAGIKLGPVPSWSASTACSTQELRGLSSLYSIVGRDLWAVSL